MPKITAKVKKIARQFSKSLSDRLTGINRHLLRLEKETALQQAELKIKGKYGKNAILKGTNFLEGAMTRERNMQVGGHKA